MTKVTVKEYTKLEGHKQGVYAMLWLQNEGVLLSAGGDGSLVKWDFFDKVSAIDKVSSFDKVSAFDKSSEIDGSSLLAESSSGTRGSVGKLFAQLPEPVFCLMDAGGGEIWAGTQGGNLFVLTAGAKPRMLKLSRGAIYFIARWINGCIAVGLGSGELVFLSDELKVISQLVLGKKSLRCCLGSKGWIGGSDGLIWKLDSDGKVQHCFKANEPSVFGLAMCDGALVSAGRDAQLIWFAKGFLNDASQAEAAQTDSPQIDAPQIDSAHIERVLAHNYTIHAIEFSDCSGSVNGLLSTAGMDKTIKIWDPQTKALLKVIDRVKFPNSGHTHSVNVLTWVQLKGGVQLLASAGDDKVIRLWEIVLD